VSKSKTNANTAVGGKLKTVLNCDARVLSDTPIG
jgi:hypothetical protein